MGKLLILLFLAFSLCSAQAAKKTETIYDTVIVNKTVIDTITIHKFNYDSATVAALDKTHTLYNAQFSTFTMVVSILVILLVAFTAIAVTFNFRSVENSKKEVKEELTKIKDFETKISDMKAELNKIEIQKNELESMKKEFKEKINDLFFSVADIYFKDASKILTKNDLNDDDINEHFNNLSLHYIAFCHGKMELSEGELVNFSTLKKIIKKYKPTYASYAIGFFWSFGKFKQCCEKKNNQKFLQEINEVYKELYTVFGENDVEGLTRIFEDFKSKPPPQPTTSAS